MQWRAMIFTKCCSFWEHHIAWCHHPLNSHMKQKQHFFYIPFRCKSKDFETCPSHVRWLSSGSDKNHSSLTFWLVPFVAFWLEAFCEYSTHEGSETPVQAPEIIAFSWTADRQVGLWRWYTGNIRQLQNKTIPNCNLPLILWIKLLPLSLCEFL